MADPFTLISLGLGTAGALYGGIKNAVEADDRKEEFLRRQRELMQRDRKRGLDARFDALYGAPDIFGARDAQEMKWRSRDVERQAEEMDDFDPMSFLPFVSQGTALAGGIYDAFNEPAAPAAQPWKRGSKLHAEDFLEPEGYSARGPSSGARIGVDDFLDPEELQYYQGWGRR